MTDSNDRLEIGVSDGQTHVLEQLAAELPEPYRILYVLLMAREDQLEGRYEMKRDLTSLELGEFFGRYRVALEQDGRHAVWVMSPAGQLVFSSHDIIYAYGPIDAYAGVLRRRDFADASVEIPAPHTHHYHRQFDPVIRDILSRYGWEYSPLRAGDDET